MRIETCFFCSKPAYPSKGIALMRNSGDMKRFCSSKCHKNFKMKRNPRKLKWTKAYRKAAGKEMVVDSTLQFAARRNVPVRYDRELVQKTLTAMSRISEIRAKRERAFYMRRIRGKRAQKLREARRLVADNEHLLPRLRGSEKRKLREMGVEEEEIEEMERVRRGDKNAAAAENGGEIFGEEKKRLKAKAKVRITVDGDEVMEMPDGEEVSDDGWGGVEDENTMDVDV